MKLVKITYEVFLNPDKSNRADEIETRILRQMTEAAPLIRADNMTRQELDSSEPQVAEFLNKHGYWRDDECIQAYIASLPPDEQRAHQESAIPNGILFGGQKNGE